MFWKQKPNASEKTLERLLETPAAKALLGEQERQEDEAALALRVPVLDAIEASARTIKDAELIETELAEQERALLAQLDEVRQDRTRKASERSNAQNAAVAAERELRQRHGEQAVLDAERLCSSTRLQLEAERARLANVPTLARDPKAHPEDWMARHVINPERQKADIRIAVIDSKLSQVQDAQRKLAALRRARLAPRELQRRCDAIFADAGIVKLVRPQWEGDTMGPDNRQGTPELPLYTLPSVAKQIVAAAAGK